VVPVLNREGIRKPQKTFKPQAPISKKAAEKKVKKGEKGEKGKQTSVSTQAASTLGSSGVQVSTVASPQHHFQCTSYRFHSNPIKTEKKNGREVCAGRAPRPCGPLPDSCSGTACRRHCGIYRFLPVRVYAKHQVKRALFSVQRGDHVVCVCVHVRICTHVPIYYCVCVLRPYSCPHHVRLVPRFATVCMCDYFDTC